MALIKAIECDGTGCSMLVKADSEDYFTIMGNIFVGQNGGIVGNNLDDEGKVINNTFFCKSCFVMMINDAGASHPVMREKK